jgi:hypothetical protein
MYFIFRANSRKQSPSWEADSRSTTQEISSLLCNLKIHYYDDDSPPMDTIPSQLKPVCSHPISFKIHIIHLCPDLSRCLIPSGRPTKMFYVYLISPMYATCHAQQILLDMMTLTIKHHLYFNLFSNKRKFSYSWEKERAAVINNRHKTLNVRRLGLYWSYNVFNYFHQILLRENIPSSCTCFSLLLSHPLCFWPDDSYHGNPCLLSFPCYPIPCAASKE